MAQVAEQTSFKVTVPGFKHWELDKPRVLLAVSTHSGLLSSCCMPASHTPLCLSPESALSLTQGTESNRVTVGEKPGLSRRSDQLGLRHVLPHNGDIQASPKMARYLV